ncbi:zinc finger protein OZF-like [Ostrinia nubilalis]|uniref:zinc finger protein OZF-like n=1 Tax=Ostrinia nubilalis TaxID=29057 RepID=UPI00308259D8
MAESNVVIKKEIEDDEPSPSYCDTELNSVPNSANYYERSTEFVKIERSYSPLRQIKDEPLDLTPERPPACRPDSPQEPDSTTDTIKTEERTQCTQIELELIPEDCHSQEQPEKSQIKHLSSEKQRRNELKQKYVTDNGKFTCLICRKIYMTKASIIRHLLSHTDEDFKNPPHPQDLIYKCELCGKTFKSSANLMQHNYIHLDKKLFKCDQCDRSFTLKSNLIRHQGKSQCKLPDTPLVCHLCNKKFPKGSLLTSHLKKHSTERPFGCDMCGMNFKYKSTLIRHVQHHNGFKPFSCNICNKTFTHFGLIKPHMRMHTGEKPYACPVCSKKFSHKHNMLRHSVRHDKIVNLNCPVCNKAFPKESRLKYHMRTHMDIKCFACAICPKKFSHRQNVIRHYSRKHPDKIYESAETDASVALKLWNEVKNNKIPLPTLDTNKRKVRIYKNKADQTDNNHDVNANEAEEILPDVKKPEIAFEAVNIKEECETDSD